MDYNFEYDNELGIYTIYSIVLPQIWGEGSCENFAIEDFCENAISFVNAVHSNPNNFDGFFDESQIRLIEMIASCNNNKSKVRAILNH
jgi:hypothetical protein